MDLEEEVRKRNATRVFHAVGGDGIWCESFCFGPKMNKKFDQRGKLKDPAERLIAMPEGDNQPRHVCGALLGLARFCVAGDQVLKDAIEAKMK